MSSGQDVRFAEDKVAQGLQLTNKLWNAARLILLGVGSDARAAIEPVAVEDRWILSRLQRARDEVATRFGRYEFSRAALSLYEFVYGELCDWYLELVKPRLREGDPALAATLVHVLTETLALAHPMIPFVTEEIYSYVPGADGLLAGRVDTGDSPVDEQAERALADVIGAVQAIRGWRDEAGVRPGAVLGARLAAAGGYADTADQVARLARLQWSAEGVEPVATVPVPGGFVEITPSKDLDLGAAGRKRDAERARLEAEIARSEGKLANAGFVERAPAAVVQAERDKLERLQAELEVATTG
jgi:valyl-tRNA synthetase